MCLVTTNLRWRKCSRQQLQLFSNLSSTCWLHGGAQLIEFLFAGCSGQCQINPPSGTFLNEGDELIMLRPTAYPKGGYTPAAEAVQLPDSERPPFEVVN